MAKNTRTVAAPPAAVWQVLAQPESYARWVVGSERIRRVEGSWPQPGSRFHHHVGFRRLGVDDHTEVLECEPQRRLVLRAHSRPLLTARVEIGLEPWGGGTRITMLEGPDGAWRFIFPPPLHLAIYLRNTESLRRLEELAAGATAG